MCRLNPPLPPSVQQVPDNGIAHPNLVADQQNQRYPGAQQAEFQVDVQRPVHQQHLPRHDQRHMRQIHPISGVRQVAHPEPFPAGNHPKQPHQPETHQPGIGQLKSRRHQHCAAAFLAIRKNQRQGKNYQQRRRQRYRPAAADHNAALPHKDAQQKEHSVPAQRLRVDNGTAGLPAQPVHQQTRQQRQRYQPPPQPTVAESQAQFDQQPKQRYQCQQIPQKPQMVQVVSPSQQPGQGMQRRKIIAAAQRQQPYSRRHQRNRPDRQWQADPPQTMPQYRPQPVTPPQQGRKEPAEQKENRHPKAVNRRNQDAVARRHSLRCPRVGQRPLLNSQQEQRPVQRNAQNHRHAAQSVQVMKARPNCRRRLRRGYQTSCHRSSIPLAQSGLPAGRNGRRLGRRR